MTGQLFLVATPIGNLGDITFRAAEVLRGVSEIACEDTRVTRKLLSHLGITKKLISVREANEIGSSKVIVAKLLSGQSIAYCSDAGTPALSDPGARLVAAASEAGIPVVPVPGPSALAAAISAAGLSCDSHYFGAFLPAKSSARRKALDALSEMPCPLIFYESPHRIRATLTDISAALGDRDVIICRELTKRHEEISRTTVAEAGKRKSWLGEITLILLPSNEPAAPPGEEEILAWIADEHKNSELSTKQLAAICAGHFAIPRSAAYSLVLRERSGRRKN